MVGDTEVVGREYLKRLVDAANRGMVAEDALKKVRSTLQFCFADGRILPEDVEQLVDIVNSGLGKGGKDG